MLTRLLLLVTVLITPSMAYSATANNLFIDGFHHSIEFIFADFIPSFLHVLVILSIGVLSSKQKPSSRWAVIGSLLFFMSLGGLSGLIDIYIPSAEMGEWVAGIGVGILIIMNSHLSTSFIMAVVGVLGLYHGYEYGNSLTGEVSRAYLYGYIIGVVTIHILGVVLGQMLALKLKFKGLKSAAGYSLVLISSLYVIEHYTQLNNYYT